MRKVFLGRPVFWSLWLVICVALWPMGAYVLHVRNFNLFVSVLLAVTAGCIIFIVVSYRPGEAITRETIEEPSAVEPTEE